MTLELVEHTPPDTGPCGSGAGLFPKVCIIHFENGYQNPLVRFQVTIDLSRTSDLFIRFGPWSGDKKGQGDEITGWVPKTSYVIDEVLGELHEDGTVTPLDLKAVA